MGAPTPESLVWDEDELLNAPIPPFSGENISDDKDHTNSSVHSVRWRVLQDPRRAADIIADHLQENEGTIFLTTGDLTVASAEDPVFKVSGEPTPTHNDDNALSQFYDHSFAIYETFAVSSAESPEWESSGDSSVQTGSTDMSVRTQVDQEGALAGRFPPVRGTISDLKDIPNAAYLHSIIPQTMSVNLVVGVIAVYPRRRVLTRRWKRELDIVELIVGDETKTGFGVTVWLPPVEQTTNPERTGGGIHADVLGQTVAGLRPRDIVLVRTVGLSSFRERVYGQSLRHGLTQIDLLYRQPVDLTDASGIYTSRAIDAAGADDLQTQKVRRVRDWIRNFVGSGADGAQGDSGMCRASSRPLLPPDTQ